MNKTKIPYWVNKLASVQFTIFNLVLMMLLVFLGTLAQVHMGAFAVTQVFFNSFFVFGPDLFGVPLPIFPGGLSVGFLWSVNLTAAFIVRLKFRKKDLGILILHAGLILLLIGQFLTQMLAVESKMEIEEGQTKNFVERSFRSELTITNVSDLSKDQEVSIPSSLLKKEGDIQTPHLPFDLHVVRFLPNADLSPTPGGFSGLANRGVGLQVSVKEIPVSQRDDERNNASAFVEIVDGESSLGIWLVSLGLGAPQEFSFKGDVYRLRMRPQRRYLPFSLTLKDFQHDVYPGTNIPKNFSSLVQLEHPEKNENRDVLIYMNHPLRYGGLTFYQASFGKNDTLSVLQVVKNPAWITPYLSCLLMTLGLAIQFMIHLVGFVRKRP